MTATKGIIPARAGFTTVDTWLSYGREDHPRACGVYITGPIVQGCDVGSSPRVRGLRRHEAGKHSSPPDHPRACGVYSCSASFRLTMSGSSPRVRGLHGLTHIIFSYTGIIPARAGFTSAVKDKLSVIKDHPRACGVYPVRRRSVKMQYGSSPRVRGLLDAVPDGVLQPGIIPARAGFTRASGRRRRRLTDHPRACGVY